MDEKVTETQPATTAEGSVCRRTVLKAASAATVGVSLGALGAGAVSGGASRSARVQFEITDFSPESLALAPEETFGVSATVTNSGEETATQQVLAGVAESEAAFESDDTSSDAVEDVTISFNNEGSSHWRVLDVDGASADDVVDGDENPTISLEVGRRYTVDNGGWLTHPFVLTDADDAVLLSQVHDGEFEDDPDVDWEHGGDETLSFTLTPELGDSLARYHCATHVGEMRGEITVQSGSLLVEETIETTLEPDESETLPFEGLEAAALDAGEYVYGVATGADSRTATLVVEPLLAYADEEGTVGFEGLNAALDDWRNGEVGFGLLRDVIDAWRSGEPVVSASERIK